MINDINLWPPTRVTLPFPVISGPVSVVLGVLVRVVEVEVAVDDEDCGRAGVLSLLSGFSPVLWNFLRCCPSYLNQLGVFHERPLKL